MQCSNTEHANAIRPGFASDYIISGLTGWQVKETGSWWLLWDISFSLSICSILMSPCCCLRFQCKFLVWLAILLSTASTRVQINGEPAPPLTHTHTHTPSGITVAWGRETRPPQLWHHPIWHHRGLRQGDQPSPTLRPCHRRPRAPDQTSLPGMTMVGRTTHGTLGIHEIGIWAVHLALANAGDHDPVRPGRQVNLDMDRRWSILGKLMLQNNIPWLHWLQSSENDLASSQILPLDSLERSWTAERLRRRGLQHRPRYLLSDQDAETMQHLMTTCPFSAADLVWYPRLATDDVLATWSAKQPGRTVAIAKQSTPKSMRNELATITLLIPWWYGSIAMTVSSMVPNHQLPGSQRRLRRKLPYGHKQEHMGLG
jgi:hypothetical protein